MAIRCLLLLAFISCVSGSSSRHLGHEQSIIDATHFGFKARGSCNGNAAALTSAWKKACNCPTPMRLVIPQGEYDLSPVILKGPCKSRAITFEVFGTLKASTDKKSYDGKERAWIMFDCVDHLTLTGNKHGVFNGQGESFWKDSKCVHKKACKLQLPASLKFYKITNSVISSFTSLNSPAFHMHVVGCNNFTAQDLTVTAPEDSPNTDGMHISKSCNIKVLNSKFGTGDDCVSVGHGNKDITISHIECGPGHGISVGSLGKYDYETPVTNVLVTDCTLTKTDNGARIKTWLASPNLKATGITFQNIIMKEVKNPIIIDQEYGSKSSEPSHVKLSNVRFKNIKGTTVSEEVVNLICSKKCPCESVELCDVDLKFVGKGRVNSTCVNAQVKFVGKQNPPPPACSRK